MPGYYHLEGNDDRRFPCFETPALRCPTSTLRTFVKQVNPSMLNPHELAFLNAAFGGFLTGVKPPGEVHAMIAALTPNSAYEDRLPRRYDGDRTLPRGRYYTLCQTAEGDDSGTLVRELKFYAKAETAEGHIEIYDPAIAEQREMIGRLGLDANARGRIVVRFLPFAQPAHVGTPSSVLLSIPVKIEEMCVDNVLDLRRPESLDWVFRTIPNLHFIVNDRGETQHCFPFRPELASFGDFLPCLMDQSRGGGNFDKLVGLFLRQIGVSGLVFPSVRNDAYTYVVDGEPREFHGWSFVDYRNSPPQHIAVFFELRPDWPRTLSLEGGDDEAPRQAAFADEFYIQMTENFPSTGGTLVFRGVASRIDAYNMVDSLEGALRYRLPDLSDEDVTKLKTLAVSLGSRDASSFAAMILFSLLGLSTASVDLGDFVRKQLKQHPVADLLARCANPPPVEAERLDRTSGALHALFEGSLTQDAPEVTGP